VDDAAGLVLEYLARAGLSSTTIVVVTSDHGESLFEHGRGIGHGDHLFGDHVTHVPLVIHDPRRPSPRREAAVVRATDLAPTLYELTGVSPPGDLDGRSLARALDGPIDSSLAFAETDLWLSDNPAVPASLRLPYPGFGGLLEIDARHGHEIQVRAEYRLLTVVARHRMVRDDRYKLIYAPTPSGARTFLYDTMKDPDELVDVARDHPEEVERLSSRLWAWMLSDPELERSGDLLAPRADASASQATVSAPDRLAPGSADTGIRIGAP
jgi:arylsulfatase A-like enzyme